MAAEETLDGDDERVWSYIKAYDFVKYPWSTEEAAAELGLDATRVYQAIARLQKAKRREFFLYYRDGSVHIQTE